ncbi:MAG TPA: ABC transporter substrate-binding protein, partial [Xanthobacteraceae bacterium]|nr:ABC transporter substrate-binding protein [Xanthobacteraceae bacterium]
LALKALLAGELDSYEGSPGGPLIALSRGADIKIIGCYWPGLTYGIYSKPSIGSIKDLKGKSFAISSPGALPDLVVRAILETADMSASDVRFVVMGSDTDRFKAVAAGIVDAGAASTGFEPIAQKSGVKLLVQAHDLLPNYLRFCMYTTGKALAAHRDETAKFLAAEMAAFRFAMANRDKTIALAKDITGAKPEDPGAAFIYDEVMHYKAIDPDMAIPTDKLAWMQQLLVRTGNLKSPSDLKAAVDDGPREKALELSKK